MSTQTGTLLFDQGQYDEAKAEFQRALALNANDAAAHNGLGRVALIQGRHQDAERSFRKASEVNPAESLYHYNLGLALESLKRCEEAIKEYQQATEINPDDAEAYNNLGNALLDQRSYGEAIEKFEKAVEVDDSYPYAYHNMAYILERQGKYKAAKEGWKRARDAYEKTKGGGRFFTNADDFQYFGSVLHEAFGELDRAEEIYKEGLKLDPNHVGILSGLVNLYLEEKDKSTDQEAAANFWKAREIYKKAFTILNDLLKKKHGENINSTEKRTINYWKAQKEFKKSERILIERLKKEEEMRNLLNLGQLQIKIEEYDEAEKISKKLSK